MRDAMDSPGDEAGTGRRAHLERSRRVWDRWSDHYGLSEADYEPMRGTAVEYLNLEPGDAVLDVGCGPGVNFASLRDAVGPHGHIVGVDYSPAMVDRARARVADRGWENVTVRRADAGRVDLPAESFDATLATLSLSVMPSPRAVAERVHEALRPGGRFVVFDVRAFPSGPLRVVNPLVRRALHLVGNWNTEADVPTAIESAFGECEVVETYFAGLNYTAVATRDLNSGGSDPGSN
ncbi:methyltransferase domain-containing protein [Halorussus sp. JP-T4]|nr:methyltransferase domain-containing protein [Halorussus sp. JP-T4]